MPNGCTLRKLNEMDKAFLLYNRKTIPKFIKTCKDQRNELLSALKH